MLKATAMFQILNHLTQNNVALLYFKIPNCDLGVNSKRQAPKHQKVCEIYRNGGATLDLWFYFLSFVCFYDLFATFKEFICSIYVPLCHPAHPKIQPCRQLCHQVKSESSPFHSSGSSFFSSTTPSRSTQHVSSQQASTLPSSSSSSVPTLKQEPFSILHSYLWSLLTIWIYYFV